MWDAVIDQGLTKGRKLHLYLNDRCDTVYGVEKRPLVLDTLLLTPSAATASNAPDTAACVVYRPQRFDKPPVESTDFYFLHRARQEAARREGEHTMRRMQHAVLFRTVCRGDPFRKSDEGADRPNPATPAAAEAAYIIYPIEWDTNEFGEHCTEGWVVECAHRSTLTLSSLRTSEFRGTDAKSYVSWIDCVPHNALTSQRNTLSTRSPLLSQEGQWDVLPFFNDIYEHRVVLPGHLECIDWGTWFNFFKMRARDYVLRDDKAPTIRVWSPAWWAFDPVQQTVTFYVATEPVLRLVGMDSLARALAPSAQPGGGGGLEQVAQLFLPQLTTGNTALLKLKDSFVCIPFAEKSAAAAGSQPPPAGPSAPKLPLPSQGQQQKLSPAAELVSSTTTTVAAAAVASPRVTFGALPSIVSLAPWVEPHMTPPMSATAWLRHAASFVFSATAARTELGCVPLVLCDTEAVYDEVCNGVLQSGVCAAPQPSWTPFVVPLYDVNCMEKVLLEALPRQRCLLRHIFVVTSPRSAENRAITQAVSRTALFKNLQTCYKLLRNVITDSPAAQRIFYMSTDAMRRDFQAALSPSARVI
jgi:hypothetical protein